MLHKQTSVARPPWEKFVVCCCLFVVPSASLFCSFLFVVPFRGPLLSFVSSSFPSVSLSACPLLLAGVGCPGGGVGVHNRNLLYSIILPVSYREVIVRCTLMLCQTSASDIRNFLHCRLICARRARMWPINLVSNVSSRASRGTPHMRRYYYNIIAWRPY